MKYLNETDINTIGTNWNETIDVIRDVTNDQEYVQPVKPYLRFNDLTNRIIAMPAYVGGSTDVAGIKWISSFPGNIHNDIPRAHSVIVLNESKTGIPTCIINTPLVSIIRTTAVSGLLVRKFMNERNPKSVRVGIVGFGPIGQNHAKMVQDIVGDKLDTLYVYDQRSNIISDVENVTFTDDWRDFYNDVDIMITATVSSAPYIDIPSPKGQLFLNVSLRDVVASQTMLDSYDVMIVDDWEEVNREDTDIENFHLNCNLQEKDTLSIFQLNDVTFDDDKTIHFSPMGMAIYDMAISTLYLNKSNEHNIGTTL